MEDYRSIPRLGLEKRDKDQHISVREHTHNGVFPVHWHDCFEIEIVTEGEGTHSLNGVKRPIEEGTVYILNPTDFHTLSSDSAVRLLNISFDETAISEQRLVQLSGKHFEKQLVLDTPTLERISVLAQMLEEEVERADGGCQRELLECILCTVLRGAVSHESAEQSHINGIKKALLYLNMHFRENPSLAEVSAQAGFHPHYFSQLFKQITGENYVSRLNTLKVGYAKELLARGLSVSEACHRSGFGSLSNFLTVFKRHVGTSPESYRRDTFLSQSAKSERVCTDN